MSEVPPIVQRYLARASGRIGLDGHTHRLRQEGALRTGLHTRRWMPFTAMHEVRDDVAQFRWEARVRAAPCVHLHVIDELRDGEGSGAVLLGPLPLSKASGTLPMHSGALHRYLAEAVWYPAALRPGTHLRWMESGDRRATAVLRDGDAEVALDFVFDEHADVTSVYTPGRWGRFGGEFRQAAWEGHFSEYRDYQGLRLPAAADVGWHDDGRWEPVWRARVTPIVRGADD